MILTPRKLIGKYKRQPKDSNSPSIHECICGAHAYTSSLDSHGYFESDMQQTFLAPPRSTLIPGPFPSPSPAMEELGLNLVLPPPPPSPPSLSPQYPMGDSMDELRLRRPPTTIYWGSAAIGGKPELSRTTTTSSSSSSVRAPAPAPLDLAASVMHRRSLDSPTASTSQCPTPRASIIDLRITPASPRNPSKKPSPRPSSSPSLFSPQSPPQSPTSLAPLSDGHSSPWTADLVYRTRQTDQRQPSPMASETPVHEKWVQIPDSEPSSPTEASPASPLSPASSVHAEDDAADPGAFPIAEQARNSAHRPDLLLLRRDTLAECDGNRADAQAKWARALPEVSPLSPQSAARDKGALVADAEIRLLEQLHRVKRRYEEWQEQTARAQREMLAEQAARGREAEAEAEAVAETGRDVDEVSTSSEESDDVEGNSESAELVHGPWKFQGIRIEKSFLLEFECT